METEMDETKEAVKVESEKDVTKETDKGLKSIAEVRMLMYIIPVAAILVLLAWLLSSR